MHIIATNHKDHKPCFLLLLLAATAAHIMHIGHVKKSPMPTVNIPTTIVTMNMIIPPVTVEYNIPNGPKKKVSNSAIPTLFGDVKITCRGSCLDVSIPFSLMK
jgi:hypothetical protein